MLYAGLDLARKRVNFAEPPPAARARITLASARTQTRPPAERESGPATRGVRGRSRRLACAATAVPADDLPHLVGAPGTQRRGAEVAQPYAAFTSSGIAWSLP
jgi:hypothetical protein